MRNVRPRQFHQRGINVRRETGHVRRPRRLDPRRPFDDRRLAEPEGAGRFTDATALEAAFLHGQTRFHDPGRGQGLQQIRKQVGRWNGKVSIRSGTARIADVPDWDDSPPLEEHLPFLTGAQIGIILPARVEEDRLASSGPARKGDRL